MRAWMTLALAAVVVLLSTAQQREVPEGHRQSAGAGRITESV